MSDYGHYVAYRNATNDIPDRVERTLRTREPGPPRRRSRRAIARGLHAIADRIDG